MLNRDSILGYVNIDKYQWTINITALEVTIYRLLNKLATTDTLPSFEYFYKDIKFTGYFVHGRYILQIHWKDILVVEFNTSLYEITELHYGQTWVLQLYELYDEKVGIEDRQRLQELYESQKRYEEEQEKKFAPLKEE